MPNNITKIFSESIFVKQQVLKTNAADVIEQMAVVIVSAIEDGNKLWVLTS
ncbi:MAG: hypothetical protein Ctma_0619 [Catillopecten margaritatus gill symbiont]|uniref:Uncharacterized protein n=1 Tax=Catillopecten margaritatus gill symbiont TaxID=3083288 RepID=A0AAU6PFX9_9GAMM